VGGGLVKDLRGGAGVRKLRNIPVGWLVLRRVVLGFSSAGCYKCKSKMCMKVGGYLCWLLNQDLSEGESS